MNPAPLCRTAFAWAIAALCAGCMGAMPSSQIPIPVPIWDQPPDIAAALPAEFASGEGETLVLVVMYRGQGAAKRSVILGEPLFAKPAELPALAKRLDRSGVGVGKLIIDTAGVYFVTHDGGGYVPVRELCVIAANARTVSLHLPAGQWLSSEISVVDAAWRDAFAKLVASRPANPLAGATLFPIWRSSPCKQVDWTRDILIVWTDEQRARVGAFLRELPAQR